MTDSIFEQLKSKLPSIQLNVPLKEHTTFRIGGPAEYFFAAESKEEIVQAIEVAKSLHLPIFALGGGSNLLVADEGVKGLVIKIHNQKIQLGDDQIVSDAGSTMERLVDAAISHSLEGLEWAGGLPGTFGGAVRGNAGAFGGEIKDSVVSVLALAENFELRTFSNKECEFSYRSSVFKKMGWTVIQATLKLKKGNKDELLKIAKSRIEYRKERHPLEFPNAGSIFKNVPVSEFSREFQEQLAGVIKKDPFPVVPTAFLISEAGLKGKRIGNAEVSPKHPNFIVNKGGASSYDVVGLIEFVKTEIKNKYNIELEPEVQRIGFK